MGYDLLDAASFCDAEEEDITGELTRGMQTALQDRSAPRWTKNFWAVEETRVNDVERRGKRRLRIDIEIIQSQTGQRPRLRFEAKRLRNGTSRSDYLGTDGLGCFLDGRYAREDEIAGMLGYVQNDSVDSHALQLQASFSSPRAELCVTNNDQWVLTKFSKALDCYRTTHVRASDAREMVLLHTLLDFSAN